MCDALDALGDAIDAIESHYVTTGKWSMPSSVTVSGSTFDPVAFPMARGSQNSKLSALRNAAQPSPFGQNKETVVDSAVRKAHQLMPDQFQLSGGFDGTLPPAILEAVRSTLVPDAACISARLHKVNIYEKGGHFVDHKDTPRSETHFGSMVVLLPSYHAGGVLSVDHAGESKKVDWAQLADFTPSGYGWQYGADEEAKLAAHVPSGTLRYAAFFGDATHRISPVTDGQRVTVAYELYRDGLPDPHADALLQRAERCRSAFAALMGSAGFMPGGGHLGFECVHLYEERELGAAERSLAASSAADASARKLKGLKNEDAVLSVAAAAAGLPVEAVRLLSDGQGNVDSTYVLGAMPKSSRGFGHVRNCDGWRTKGITPDEIEDYAAGTLEQEYPNLEWVSKRAGAKKLLEELQFGEYFGNEACSNTFYSITAP